MPSLSVRDFEMFYRIDDYCDPWRKPEAVLLLHGIAESHEAWYGWIPELARQYRVVRPDLRGFGASTPMPRDFPWTLDGLVDDVVALMDELKLERCHLAGAKVGANICRALAARYPARVRSMTLLGTPPAFREGDQDRLPAWNEDFERNGVTPWARASMASRLGSRFPPEGVEWWTNFMGRTAVSTQIGFLDMVYKADAFRSAAIDADLPRITCPTLVITTEGSGVASVDETRAWQEKIVNSNLLVLPGNSYHVAASDAEQCARATLEFMRRADEPVQ